MTGGADPRWMQDSKAARNAAARAFRRAERARRPIEAALRATHPWCWLRGQPFGREISKRVRAFVLAQAQGCCLYCDVFLGDSPRWQIDHVVPRGGPYGPSFHSGPGNLVAACVSCNQGLAAPGEFFRHKWPKVFFEAGCLDGWTFWERRSLLGERHRRLRVPPDLRRRTVEQLADCIRYLDPWLQEYPAAS